MEILGLEDWIAEFEKSQGVGLAAVVKRLNDLTSSDESSAAELAEVVLKDATLSGHVIRIANSVHFNPQHIAINTVSRAIFQIGFETIKSICISIKLLEELLKDNPSDELISLVATTTHAAIQARNLCKKARAKTREEVYVTTLLINLAELIVLSTPAMNVQALAAQYKPGQSRQERDRLAERFIGVSITRLALTLAKRWNFGQLALEVLHPGEHPSDSCRAVQFGERISLAANIGLNSHAMKQVIKELAEFSGMTDAEISEQVSASAAEAKEVAIKYGNRQLLAHLPDGGKVSAVDARETLVEPNKARQLEITQDLNSLIMSGGNMNAVFQTVLEGLHSGVGLERVALAIFDKERKFLMAKHVIGDDKENWVTQFRFAYEKSSSSFFGALFSQRQPQWVRRGSPLTAMVPDKLKALVAVKEFLVAPLAVGDKRIGIIYADMGRSLRLLNDDYFSGFSHFAQQANVCLAVIASRTSPRAC